MEIKIVSLIPSTQDCSESTTIKRVATSFDSWSFTNDDLHTNNQLSLLKLVSDGEHCHPHYNIVRNFLRQKCSGYRSQDLRKDRYCTVSFMYFDHIVSLLLNDLTCFYCKESVLIVYENSRDPQQWTLERIDNSIGHNCGNCVVACLKCNIRRRTMYYERYRMTKQMRVIKID